MMTQIILLGLGIASLPILFRLALRLRLGIPMAYAVFAPTLFQGWYHAHTALADSLFFALLGLVALSWVVTLVRKAAAALA